MELSEFLIYAKHHGYATGKEAIQLQDGRKELRVERDDYIYEDRYIGEDPFIGEELVWQAGHVVWGMNFYGRVIGDAAPAERIYTFLQTAMRHVTEDRPFRGPRTFTDQDFTYRNESQGTLEQFIGVETISYQGQVVYQLDYHGGCVRAH